MPRPPLLLPPLLLGCAPAVPQGGHPSGWADVACAAVPEHVRLGPPVPWIDDVLPPYSDFAAALPDTPYWREGVGPVDTTVGALAVDGDLLVVGVGDWTHKTGSLYCHERGGLCPREDAAAHGMPLLGIDGEHAAPEVLGVLHEEEVRRIRRTGLGLLVPGTDPSRGDGAPACARPRADPACPEEADGVHPFFRVGNSTQVRDGVLRSEAVIPDASHVFDVVPMHGTLWAVGSGVPVEPPDFGGTFATVWRSEDDGRTWTLAWRDANQEGRRRLLSALPVGERILVFGLHKQDEVHLPLRYRLEQGVVSAAPEVAPELVGWVQTAAVDADLGLAWAGGQAVLFADEDGALGSWALDLSDHGDVVDAWLLCAGDLLLLVRRGDRTRVLRTADLERFDVVGEWTGAPAATTLAWWRGGLVLGAAGGALWRVWPEG